MLDPAQRARLLRDNRARIGLVIVALMVLSALFAPVIARHDPIKIDLAGMLERPSGEHWMGTDIQGRDVWARLVYGSRVSIAVGVISQGIALIIGGLPAPF
jgi:ABC-type dipeptide/oligopeptide/nickel transport system permease subunit